MLSDHRSRCLYWPRRHERFVAASDAALESPGEGAGGFLLIFFQDSTETMQTWLGLTTPLLHLRVMDTGRRKDRPA